MAKQFAAKVREFDHFHAYQEVMLSGQYFQFICVGKMGNNISLKMGKFFLQKYFQNNISIGVYF